MAGKALEPEPTSEKPGKTSEFELQIKGKIFKKMVKKKIVKKKTEKKVKKPNKMLKSTVEGETEPKRTEADKINPPVVEQIRESSDDSLLLTKVVEAKK